MAELGFELLQPYDRKSCTLPLDHMTPNNWRQVLTVCSFSLKFLKLCFLLSLFLNIRRLPRILLSVFYHCQTVVLQMSIRTFIYVSSKSINWKWCKFAWYHYMKILCYLYKLFKDQLAWSLCNSVVNYLHATSMIIAKSRSRSLHTSFPGKLRVLAIFSLGWKYLFTIMWSIRLRCSIWSMPYLSFGAFGRH